MFHVAENWKHRFATMGMMLHTVNFWRVPYQYCSSFEWDGWKTRLTNWLGVSMGFSTCDASAYGYTKNINNKIFIFKKTRQQLQWLNDCKVLDEIASVHFSELFTKVLGILWKYDWQHFDLDLIITRLYKHHLRHSSFEIFKYKFSLFFFQFHNNEIVFAVHISLLSDVTEIWENFLRFMLLDWLVTEKNHLKEIGENFYLS